MWGKRMRGRPRALAAVAALAAAGLVGCGSTGASSRPSASATDDGLSAGGLRWELVTDDLAVPRELVTAGDVTFVTDQSGTVSVLEDGTPETVLDLSDAVMEPTGRHLELGLAGFAPAPDFEASGVVYTMATEPLTPADTAPDAVAVSVLTRWKADPKTGSIDAGSGVDLLRVPMGSLDHVGGEIVFDEAGALHASVGAPEGSAAAQDPASWSGKTLRVTPTAEGYTVPADNPYAHGGGIPEIFTAGHRNPWRLASDGDGVLLAEAMWQTKAQQVVRLEAGGNSGYPEVSGACWTDGALAPACERTAAGAAITPPVLEYGPEVGFIASGVAVVPDDGPDALAGSVIVSDWRGGLVVAQTGAAPWAWGHTELPAELAANRYVWDIAADRGDLYLMTTSPSMDDGRIYRLR